MTTLVSMVGPGAARAQDTQAATSRQAIEQIVREYILAHPEILVESLQALEQRRREVQLQHAREAIAARHDELLTDPASPQGGNPQGDVTIVEFFDYRCRYCRQVAGTLSQLVREDPKIRLVYKEYPILGNESVLAARAALASHAQGKYTAFHDALMAAANESPTLETVLEIAAGVGLDTAKLRVDMDKPEIVAALRKNHALAQALGINVTPSFVVGTELVPGAVDIARMKSLVNQARDRPAARGAPGSGLGR